MLLGIGIGRFHSNTETKDVWMVQRVQFLNMGHYVLVCMLMKVLGMLIYLGLNVFGVNMNYVCLGLVHFKGIKGFEFWSLHEKQNVGTMTLQSWWNQIIFWMWPTLNRYMGRTVLCAVHQFCILSTWTPNSQWSEMIDPCKNSNLLFV